jgi:hypothetical protein
MGRPKGSGTLPKSKLRRHRLPVMLTDADLRRLRSLSRSEGRPLATVAYDLLVEAMSRR